MESTWGRRSCRRGCGMLVQQPWLQIGSLALYRPTPHLLRMPYPITRLSAALEVRYAIERELGEEMKQE